MPEHIYNLVPSIPDQRDFLYSAPMGVALPPNADLGTAIPPIKDQGQEGSCTGFSLSSAREALAKEHGNYLPFSPAFIYYQERKIEHDTNQDAGAQIRDGLKVLTHAGVCPESDFPYVVGGFKQAPPAAAVRDAKQYTITSYSRLPSLSALQAAIANKQPVVLGIAVYPSFEAVGADGKVPMPGPTEGPLGGHAILVVGYHDDPEGPGGGWVHLNNSWGAGHGDQGRYYLPYAYVANAQYTFEMWTLT
jgi:C1A family cysteine protease